MNTPSVRAAESVFEGHPDKIADQVSDAILDECLGVDITARTAIETLVTRGLILVAGEVEVNGILDFTQIVRNTLLGIGTTYGAADGNDLFKLNVALHGQSPSIKTGLSQGGAGDQAIVYGMATDETPDHLPLPFVIATAISKRAASVRRKMPHLGLCSDGKALVVLRTDRDRSPELLSVTVSQQHLPDRAPTEVRASILHEILSPVINSFSSLRHDRMRVFVNEAAPFIAGGPSEDTGLTGRKMMVDSYGGLGRHGGGAFSGKDPSKVDRTGAYMARWIAKSLVACGLAKQVEVMIAYTFGMRDPVALSINSFGTGHFDDELLAEHVRGRLDLSTTGIIDRFRLRSFSFLQTAKFGHFGNPIFPWEEASMDVTDWT